ncbi:MAG: cobalamin B12-binding domain-containing protein [Nitratireductor sp.]|nr:cobalamin B12-binding domain-containing protein [Nitratireductor sp.]
MSGRDEVPEEPGSDLGKGMAADNHPSDFEETNGASDRAGSFSNRLQNAIKDHVAGRVAGLHGVQVNRRAPEISSVYFTELLAALLEPDPRYMRLMIERLENDNAPLLAICDTLVMPISAALGKMWEEDSQSFVNISVATARLQTLVNKLSYARQNFVSTEQRHRIFLARMKGDSHTLGLSMLAACFRERGWDVDGGPDEEISDRVVARILKGNYEMFGLSINIDSQLGEVEPIIRKVVEMRNRSTARLKIAVGGPIVAERMDQFLEMGADLVTNNARDAVFGAQELIA